MENKDLKWWEYSLIFLLIGALVIMIMSIGFAIGKEQGRKDIINSEFYYIEPNDVIYIQRIKGQSFGVNSVTTSISVAATTLAFGGFVYGLVARIVNSVEKNGK